MSQAVIEPEAVMAGLKEFQRLTVDYVFRRIYLDDDPTTRFLIADEVGLGKTMVARGIIAKTIEHLRDKIGTDRIDIVYVCSNAAIAKQNINRLNLLRDRRIEVATRLTLLPIEVKSLKKHDINFVSFTPSTTFDLKSRGGKAPERLLLFHMLRGHFELPDKGLRHLLRGAVGAKRWVQRIRDWDEEIEASLHKKFLKALDQEPEILKRLRDTCRELTAGHRSRPRELRNRIFRLIGELRSMLARTCVDALEPDLIIFDEFQRFRHLIDVKEATEAAQLAQALMGFRDEKTGMQARVLLLSATPYRMYTMEGDEEDDHYRDFIQTIRFLKHLKGDDVDALERDLSEFRRGLYGSKEGSGTDLDAVRGRIEDCLRSVMVRTERVGATVKRDSMLSESLRQVPPDPDELRAAVAIDGVAQAVKARDIVEYWKSSPYLLNLMRGDGYKLKRLIRDEMANPSENLFGALDRAQPNFLKAKQIARYKGIDPANARLRALVEDTIEAGQWQWLWLPPSLPYLTPSGPYAGAGNGTKSLVFSAWNVVPDAISTICSYEAERRMLAADSELPDYSELYEKKTALLQYRTESKEGGDTRMAGMTTIALFYPCVTLAGIVDPLQLALEIGGDTANPDAVREKAKNLIRSHLKETPRWKNADSEGPVDRRWYWAALAVLDGKHASKARSWLKSSGGWRKVVSHESRQQGGAFDQHLAEFADAFVAKTALGRPPDDLIDVLADMALAGPGICALRALSRLSSNLDSADQDLMTAAVTVSEGLRTLFNLPPATALLRGKDTTTPYWRHILSYGIQGNLQAVLDEYLHVLRELSGHGSQGGGAVLLEVAAEAAEALSLRTSRVGIDEFHLNHVQGSVSIDRFNLRTRFALRFGEMKDDSGQVLARIGSVRKAFNSPFPPFILASTSIGQEGLDFHCYCHAIYHWNLPSNPVDLEQREGRVHRYKGHAVRKNVAKDFGLGRLRDSWDGNGDPWKQMFDLAVASVSDNARDLIPYWIYETEGGAKIERRVPLLPLSREHGQLRRLKRGLALYRLIFGQPRQQELLEYLEDSTMSGEAAISLAPRVD